MESLSVNVKCWACKCNSFTLTWFYTMCKMAIYAYVHIIGSHQPKLSLSLSLSYSTNFLKGTNENHCKEKIFRHTIGGAKFTTITQPKSQIL